jgi:hypothetical protein
MDSVPWDAMTRLFNREWWSRIWVVQEVSTKADTIVLCGNRSTTLEALKDTQLIMWALENRAELLGEELHSFPSSTAVSSIDMFRRNNPKRTEISKSARGIVGIQSYGSER